MIADSTGRNLVGPSCDQWGTYPAFVKIALVSSKGAVTVKKDWIVPSLSVWTIIATNHDEGIVVQVEFLEKLHQLANVVVNLSHHSGESGNGIFGFRIRVTSNLVCKLRKFFLKRLPVFIGRVHRCVRDGNRQEQEERRFLICFHKLQRFIHDEIGGVGLAI